MNQGQVLDEGSKLGGFTIVGEIGRGGMGVVYLAEQASLGRRVALKVITPALAGDPQFRVRFEREARHAASIEHPHVIPVFETGAQGEHVYLAMRYVEGDDLGSVLQREGALDPAVGARLVEQVGSALDAAHAKGLVHRDVKPANVLLEGGDPEAHAYLTDFGLTKEQAAVSRLTNTGAWVGTIDYAAPEQIDGSGTDARADVYSLGCVLYEVLTGDIPFAGTPTQKMWAHMSNPPPSLAQTRPELASHFDPVISRALAKRADERFPSAGDLGRAATAAARGSEVTVPERSVATGVAAGALPTAASPTVGPSGARPAATRAADSSVADRETAALPPQPPTEQQPAAGGSGGSRRAFGIAAVLLALAAGIGAAAFLVSQLNGSEPDVTQTVATPTAPVEGEGGETSDGSGGTEEPAPEPNPRPGSPASITSYESDQPGFAYRAELPSGNGWSVPAETLETDGLLHTEVTGPDGYFAFIDYTPGEPPDPGDGAVAQGQIEHPEFGPATEYAIPESEFISGCKPSAPCIDYIVDDGQGGGWGVLAGGPDEAVTADIAADIALSIRQ